VNHGTPWNSVEISKVTDSVQTWDCAQNAGVNMLIAVLSDAHTVRLVSTRAKPRRPSQVVTPGDITINCAHTQDLLGLGQLSSRQLPTHSKARSVVVQSRVAHAADGSTGAKLGSFQLELIPEMTRNHQGFWLLLFYAWGQCWSLLQPRYSPNPKA
jgi:hypothetical protein